MLLFTIALFDRAAAMYALFEQAAAPYVLFEQAAATYALFEQVALLNFKLSGLKAVRLRLWFRVYVLGFRLY